MQMREAHRLLSIIALTMSIIRWHGARWRKLLSQWLPNMQQRAVCGSDCITQLATIGSTTFYGYFIMLSPRFSLISSLNYRDRNNGKRSLFSCNFTVNWKIFPIALSKSTRKSIVSLEQSPTSLTMSGRLRQKTWEWSLMSKFHSFNTLENLPTLFISVCLVWTRNISWVTWNTWNGMTFLIFLVVAFVCTSERRRWIIGSRDKIDTGKYKFCTTFYCFSSTAFCSGPHITFWTFMGSLNSEMSGCCMLSKL